MATPFATRIRRAFRKHGVLLVSAALFTAIVFFPMLSGQQLSPADIFAMYPPWRDAGHRIANGLLNDPATGWFPEVAMMRRGGSFLWNPHAGGGVPGWHSAGSAIVSPFALLPALFLPLGFFFAGMVALKFTTALLLAYGWLREERLGRNAAAVGALVCAAAGAASAWWLWQSTNATVLCPAALWIVARMKSGKPTPISLCALTALGILLSGFPSAIVYVWYVAGLYALVSLPARKWGRSSFNILCGAAIAAAIALPSLAPFVDTIRHSGYLESRSAAYALYYPPSHLAAFWKPYRLVGPHGWIGDPLLGRNDNFLESTVYSGKFPLLLAIAAVVAGAGRRRWFWISATAVLVCAMFGLPWLRDAVGALPGMRFAPLTRMRLVLPFGIGYLTSSALSGSGHRIRKWKSRGSLARGIAFAAGLIVATELALFARSFLPFIDARDSVPREPPSIAWLRAQPRPFRIAALDTTLWPDTSEYAGLEDIRSHFPVERAYRQLISAVDTTSFGSDGTIILLHRDRTDLQSPVLHFLNVRFMLDTAQSRTLDREATRRVHFTSVAWRGHTLSAGESTTTVVNEVPGAAVAAVVECRATASAGLVFRMDSGRRLVARLQPGVTRVFLPLASGSPFALSIEAVAGTAEVRTDAGGAVEVAMTSFPWVLAYRDADVAVFRNLAARDRFFAAVRDGKHTTAIRLVGRALDPRAHVSITATSPSEFRILTNAPAPFLLASSEKRTSELLVAVDGRAVETIAAEGLFAALPIGPGRHVVTWRRRIPPSRLAVSVLGMAALIVAAATELWRRRPLSRPGEMLAGIMT